MASSTQQFKRHAIQHATLLQLRILFAFLLISSALVAANEAKIADESDSRQQCSGMYSRRDWGGSIDPYIKVDLSKPSTATSTESSVVSLVIFEWTDVDYIGLNTGQADGGKVYVCDKAAIDSKYCSEDNYGQFLLQGSTNGSIASVFTKALTLSGDESQSVTYDVRKTGFYCVGSYALTADEGYVGTVNFQNAFGKLPASQIAKLPFYGGLAIAYAVVLAFWMFLYVQYRSDILAVQNYITACAAFLAIEMVIVWGYYDVVNTKGHTVFSRFYMVFVAILNAFRNAFTFFLLLIVCMGYGVVKPSLGSNMIKCRILAGLHFVFGVVYAIASFLITPDSAGPLILLVILPLAATMTAFYLWILSSLTSTIRDLTERKQNVKALMYRRLWRLLFASILIIFGFFFVNSLIFADRNSPDFIPSHWRSRWFVLDGWLNVVYFFDFLVIAFLWRPTRDNRRFAMSDELAQDDGDGFEIASLAGSLDEEEGIGAGRQYDPVSRRANPYGAQGDADSLAGSLHAGATPYAEDGREGSAGQVEVVEGNVSGNGKGKEVQKETEETERETMFEAPDDQYDRWSEDDDLDEDIGEATPASQKKEPGKDD
ncbi:lung seven transmembrane receptor-domain-containing protein [Lipomyces orientalis]|uniref:Lung seven transmembrane receptor-domain-containing protein n=1 Tax=Lipomyces orientalis TaxID=1233043 RepID=A0ACC3TK24_9ASCO